VFASITSSYRARLASGRSRSRQPLDQWPSVPGTGLPEFTVIVPVPMFTLSAPPCSPPPRAKPKLAAAAAILRARARSQTSERAAGGTARDTRRSVRQLLVHGAAVGGADGNTSGAAKHHGLAAEVFVQEIIAQQLGLPCCEPPASMDQSR
jgi:hypothetical protein